MSYFWPKFGLGTVILTAMNCNALGVYIKINPLYKTVCYSMVLDIDGLHVDPKIVLKQKCMDYIEK